MATDILKGHHYKATIVGYNDKDSIFVELENKFTAYLDISMYNYENEDNIKNRFKVMRTIDVVVTDVDDSNVIKCIEYNLYNSNAQDDKKHSQKKKQKQPKSETLSYSLGSLLSNIHIEK